MPKILITGANRGIGLEFARQYSAEGWDVTATARESDNELDKLGVRVESLDMRDLDAVTSFGIDGALGVAAAVLNPGWVQTRMGGPNATLEPPESVAQMRKVIDALDLSRTGKFIDRSGSEIPW